MTVRLVLGSNRLAFRKQLPPALASIRSQVIGELEKAQWSDEYWFAIPDGAKVGSFAFECRKARFETPIGKVLDGYVVNEGHCICLFGHKWEWDINIQLFDVLGDKINKLKKDIGLTYDSSLFPLKISVIPTGERFTFSV